MGRSANVHLLMALQTRNICSDGAIRDNFAIRGKYENLSVIESFKDGIWVVKVESILGTEKGQRLYFLSMARWNNIESLG